LKYFIYITIVVFASLFACKARQSVKENSANGNLHPDSVFTSIERSPCFGKCPVFKAVILNSGKAVYEGRSSVKKLGMFTGLVSEAQIKLLQQKAMDLKMDTLLAEYVNPHLADFPSHKVSFLIKGELKSIYIMSTDPPLPVTEYEQLLEETLDQVNWTKMEPEQE
jgi:Domain of unknown function (DUF6438)